jgi:hypothetical protein
MINDELNASFTLKVNDKDLGVNRKKYETSVVNFVT